MIKVISIQSRKNPNINAINKTTITTPLVPNDKVTVNFENAGKKVINAKNVELKKLGK